VDMRVERAIGTGHGSADLGKGELAVVRIGIVSLLGWYLRDMAPGRSVVDKETVCGNDVLWVLVDPLRKKVV